MPDASHDNDKQDSLQPPIIDALEAVHAISLESEPEPASESDRLHRRNSQWRANRVLGRIVPVLLLGFILIGWYYMQTTMAPYLRTQMPRSAFLAYMCSWTVLISTLVTLFLLVWLGPADHSGPPPRVPLDISSRSIPYECVDLDGNLGRCWQDDCRGRWLPPRTRHCKDCRSCRVDFDHCCVFFGTCIAQGNLLAFVAFLLTVAPTIALGLYTVTPVALAHRKIVMQQYWLSEQLFARWWNRWYSWIGGPIFRWGAGLLYCFWLYEPPFSDKSSQVPEVTFTPIMYTIFGPLLAVFCVALAWIAIRNILLAESTIDSIRAARSSANAAATSFRLVWIPDTGSPGSSGKSSGRVHQIPRSVNIYDFGKKQNVGNFLSRTVLSGGRKPVEIWSINPLVLRASLDSEAASRNGNVA